MKKMIITLIGAAFLLASGLSNAKTVGKSYFLPISLPSPQITYDETASIVVDFPGMLRTMEAGLPNVPFKTFKIAVPSGMKLKNVRLTKEDTETFVGSLARSSSQVPFSFQGGFPKNLRKSEVPNYRGSQYPEVQVQTTIQRLHGVPILIINVFIATENRDEGIVEVIKSGSLEVSFSDAGRTDWEIVLFSHQAEEVKAFVENPEAIQIFFDRKGDRYDYLIITADKFAKFTGEWNLQNFQDGLKTRGISSKIATVEDIAKSVSGIDLADKIRNYIKGQYKDFGIKYVLLAGDGDSSGSGNIIPARKFWSKIRAYNGQWYDVEENIPADLYYSCLDGDFNGDGDNKWGEPNDGINGGDVDLLAEVVVGRIPIDETVGLQNFVRKTLWMYSNMVNKKTLLMGEELFPEMNLYGGAYMDQLVGECTDHAYTTRGYTPDWGVEKLYDSGYRWSGSDALAAIKTGKFSMINHLGHSNADYNMKLSTAFSTPKFANPEPFIYYTQGCFPGNFTTDDCFIEKMVRHDKAAVVAIANTSYGLGPEDPQPETTKTPGASQMLHRRFIDEIFNGQVSVLGRAHQNSKEKFLALTTAQEVRWVFWDANYFGDPSLELKY